MEFRLLGPFEVVDDGSSLPLGGPRQRAVLALLAIHTAEVLSTDRIVEELWPEDPPPSAVRTVQAYVSRLRGCLRARRGPGDPDVLISRGPGYLLDVDPLQVDIILFDHLVDEATGVLAAGDPAGANEMLRRALALWRGAALADFVYEPFATLECQRLAERRLEAIGLRIDTDLLAARHALVVAELESLVAEHPMRERFWEQLMVALYRSGRQSDALAVYGRVRRLLVDELGIEPGPGLRRLERLVLEQSPELDGEPPAGPPATARAPAGGVVQPTESPFPARARHEGPDALPFVDRVDQIRGLDLVVDGSAPGERPRLALVVGAPGCGKSRLLHEFRHRSSERSVLVATGSAERESAAPYRPFADAVRDVLEATGHESLERIGHLREDLVWLLPELGPPPSVDDENLALARGRMMEAILRLFAVAGTGQPLVLMVDDAHRLGEGAMAVLKEILDRQWTRPVSVVVAARKEPGDWRHSGDEPLLELLQREGTVTFEVDRLLPADLSQLVAKLGLTDPDATDATELVAHLGAQTGGIPLLVRELLALWGGPEAGPGARSGGHGEMSPLIQGVIGRRLAGLSSAAQGLLETAAVIGMQFDVETLAAACSLTAARVVDILEEALDAGIVVETGVFDRLAFDHGLIRDVLGATVSTSRQVRIHGTVAETLAARGSVLDAAHHALGALGDLGVGPMVGVVVAGADAAIGSLQFDRARDLCERALERIGTHAPADHRVDLLLRLGRALALDGQRAAAEETWRAAADLARSTGSVDRLAEVALATDPHSRMVNASDLRWALLGEAMEHRGTQWSKVAVSVASEWLGEAATPARRAASGALVVEVVDAAEALGDAEATVAAYNARCVWARSGSDPRRPQWSEAFCGAARNLGDDGWLFRAHLASLIDAIAFADGSGTDRHLELLIDACARLRSPRELWWRELALCTCTRLRGEFESSDEHAVVLGETGERYAITDTPAVLGAISFTNAYHRGGLPALAPSIEYFAALFPEIPAWIFGSGLAAASAGDTAGAVRALERGLDLLTDRASDALWLTALCLGAEIAGRVEGVDPGVLDRLVALLGPASGQFVVVGTLSSEFGPVDRCLGLLASAGGRTEQSSAHFAAAVDACRRLGAAPWERHTRADWRAAEEGAGRLGRPGPGVADEDTRGLPPVVSGPRGAG